LVSFPADSVSLQPGVSNSSCVPFGGFAYRLRGSPFPGCSVALRVPIAGLGSHRLSRCWLARRPSDHVYIPSCSLTSGIRFPIRAGWAPGGPGGVRGTGTLFLLISGGRFRCGSSCDSGFHGNDPMPSVVRIFHHNRPGITSPVELSLSIPIPSPGGFESVSSSLRWVSLPSP
jgi:hypothetical protein